MVICDHFEWVMWSHVWINHHFFYRFESSTSFHVCWYVYVGYDITGSCFNLKRSKNFIFAIIREIKNLFDIFIAGRVDFGTLNLMVKTKLQNYYYSMSKFAWKIWDIFEENLKYLRLHTGPWPQNLCVGVIFDSLSDG